MGKGRKNFNQKRRSSHAQRATKNKSKFGNKKTDVVNKKAVFNRYKDKQKLEGEILKKKILEKKLQEQCIAYSESEEEEDPFGQLLTCFVDNVKKTKVLSESESSEEASEAEEQEDIDCSSKPNSAELDHQDLDENEMDDEDEEEQSGDDDEDKADEEDTEKTQSDDDPFTKHLQYDLSDELVVSLTSVPPTQEVITKTWPQLGNMIISIPKPVTNVLAKSKPKISILEEKKYADLGTVPSVIDNINFDKLNIKSQIRNNLVLANKTNLIKNDLELADVLTPLQKELFSVVNNYQDLYFSEWSFTLADQIRFVYCFHALNHMLKTRTKIIHHSAKLTNKSIVSDDYRDQGLVRPKVLILVPFKSAAYKVVKTIMDILLPKETGQVVNKKRFEDDFTGGELAMPKKNPKPEDYEMMFAGNTDDTFRLGMTITKKTLKLYTDFYSSDIIVASPLGLRMIIGAEGEEDRDYDFLSSLELLVVDQADVFLMQNWDHLLHVMDHLHLQPKKMHNTDFSRVRTWAVNGWSKYYRQTLVFSSVNLAEIKALVNKKCQNYAGKVIVVNPIESGSIRQVILQVPQIFHRFNATSPLESTESRFEYFIKEILPKQRDTLMNHTLIYVPSYFDYVRIRNYFKKEDISFVQICEYSKDSKIARARDMFFHTEAHFLLYSERAHFFRRFRIKGIRHIIFYQPPTYPHFYSEMINLMQESNQNKYGGSEFNVSVSVLYSRYELHRLGAVVGSERAADMGRAAQHVHLYVTGE